VARQFARLKFTLVRNGLRSGQYAVLFTIGAAGAAVLAVSGFAGLAALRNDRAGTDMTIVAFAGVTLGWIVVPLLGFGTDETLDPQRLSLLPLRPGQLVRGLLVAALVGIAPIATAIGLSGAIIGLARDVGTAALIALAVAGTLLFCVVASRAAISLLAPLLRSRRGRDLLVMIFTLVAVVPQSFRLFNARTSEQSVRHAFAEVAHRVRFTPFGIGGFAASEAGRGHIQASVLALLVLFALVAVAIAVWAVAIPRALTATDIAGNTEHADRRRARTPSLFPRFSGFLPRNRAGAVAAKELRYYVRDPRRRGPLIAALVLPGLFLFTTLRDAQSRPGATTLLALIALLPASGLTLNQFGLDGAALWSTIVAGDDPAADLTGKNIATATLVAPLLLIPALATAAVTHGWGYLPLTIGLAPGMLGVILAIGNIVSALAPYALPDRKNPLAANPGQGCVGGLAAMAALLVDVMILLPVGALTAYGLNSLSLSTASLVAVAFTTAYGGTAWLIGRHVAANHLRTRMPEVLEAVSPRQAG
jgi:ABC-2 type transport system permease protein